MHFSLDRAIPKYNLRVWHQPGHYIANHKIITTKNTEIYVNFHGLHEY